MTLETFLAPRSIALIGASEGTTKIGGKVLATIIERGFPGQLYPVNPRGGTLHGLPAYRNVASLPERPDLALIAVPAALVPKAIEECAAAGIVGALIFSSGFGEAGVEGERLQAELREVVRRTGIRVAGPNAEGFLNTRASTAATFSPAVHVDPGTEPPGRDIGIVSQSGGLGFALYNRGRGAGLSFGHVVSVGNQVDLNLSDFCRHLVDDPGTAALMIYLESIPDVPEFLAVAKKAARRGKPIILAKAGRSGAGRRAAASHTGALAGSAEAADAVFTRHGILRADDQDEMIDIAAGLTRHPLPAGRRVAVISTSGGTAVWMADACERFGLEVPEIDPERQAKLRAIMPDFGSPLNPVDLTAQTSGGFAAALEILMDAPYLDGLIVAGSFAHTARLKNEGARMAAMGRGAKPVLFYSYAPVLDEARVLMEGLGMHCFTTMTGCVRAFRAMADYAAFRNAGLPALTEERAAPVLSPAVRKLVASASGTLSEHATKRLLAASGIALPPEALVHSAEEAVEAARRIGLPAVLKVQSPDLPHKTEAGAVALNLRDVEAVAGAYARILAGAGRHAPQALIEGVSVAPMAPPGIEMLIGLKHDRDFGPMVMVGLGGIHVEIFADVALAPAPLDPAGARALVLSLRAAKLLQGARGAPPADLDVLVDLVCRVSALGAAAGAALAELDLNPVFVHQAGEGVTVADAVAVFGEAPSSFH
jgi:acyl-CoA synthetase (NDP forming)